MTTKDFSTVLTSSLPARAQEVIARAAVEQFQMNARLRQFCAIDRVGTGEPTYVFFKADDLTDAMDLEEGEDMRYDAAAATQTTASFVNIAKGFKISREADSIARLPLRAIQARACADKVVEREDGKLISQLASATTSITATAVWSGSSADPVKDIRSAKTEIRKLGYNPDVLILEETNAEELMSIIASNTWYGVTEQAMKSGNLPSFMGLKIVEEPWNLAEGTSYVMASGASGALLIGESIPLRTDFKDDFDSNTIKVKVWQRAAYVIARPDAAASIATI